MPKRLPRLTLYTGSTCSLCNTAKAALAQVRKARPFDLQLVNIQDRGQERWRKKYVYWIPALHLEGKEVLKGRWGESEVMKALDEWEKEEKKEGENKAQDDGQGMEAEEIEWRVLTMRTEHAYERVDDSYGLGDVSEGLSGEPLGLSRCFNCGDPEHPVRSCPEAPNHALIALSRALFQFYHQSNGDETGRFHIAEDWKLQRLRWLEDFEPGQIHSEGLQDALGLPEGGEAPWLYSMLEWGYPPGWAGKENPRELMLKRIVYGKDTEADDDPGEFSIYGEDDDEEILSLRPGSVTQASAVLTVASEDGTNSSMQCTRTDDETSSSPLLSVHRWVTYQTSLFLSDLLPIYSGRPLPPLNDDTANSAIATSAENMNDLKSTNMHIEHPWRHPDAFSAFGPVAWMKTYEKLLTRRAQVARRSDEISTRSSCLGALNPRSEADGTTSASISPSSEENGADAGEDDMDVSE